MIRISRISFLAPRRSFGAEPRMTPGGSSGFVGVEICLGERERQLLRDACAWLGCAKRAQPSGETATDSVIVHTIHRYPQCSQREKVAKRERNGRRRLSSSLQTTTPTARRTDSETITTLQRPSGSFLDWKMLRGVGGPLSATIVRGSQGGWGILTFGL
jgi:hypothetical protein